MAADRAAGKESVLLVAGEASGDVHAAKLVRALLKQAPGIEIFGMGGKALRAAGMETIVDSESSASVMGIVEVASKLGSIWRAFQTLASEAERRRARLAILVDFPDFNLRLARRLHDSGIPVLYYISPQLWAWRRGRIKTIKKCITKVVPIFPFEEEYYREHGVDAEYAGHPLLESEEAPFCRGEFLRSLELDPGLPVLALLPGSRHGEVSRLLEPMLDAFRRLRQSRPDLQALLPVAGCLDFDWFAGRVSGLEGLALVQGEAGKVLRAADAAVVASGTATLEAALAEVPFVAVYKLAAATYVIGKLLVRGVEHFAMPNLVAQQPVVKELLQAQATGERIAAAIAPFLDEERERTDFKKRIKLVRAKLEAGGSGSGCSARTAQIALKLLETART